jgi:signal transduction histidine kinase
MYPEQRLETIDSRWLFRAYAALFSFAGFLLLGWGPIWFGAHLAGQAWGKAALIRVLGAVVIAAGCCAAGFAAVEHPLFRRRGLFWFAAGHTIIWGVLVSQQTAIWGPGIAERVAQSAGVVAMVLWIVYGWGTHDKDRENDNLIRLFGFQKPDGAEQLRSKYEQQIREAARQEERNRLARDLHDSIKQQIFVIQTAAATAQARFEGDQSGTKEALDLVRGSAREAMTEMQVMLDQLRAVPLENSGLIEALRKQCEALGFRTGASVKFDLGNLPETQALPPGAHEAILRAAQEALANVGRHARAKNVLVSLGATSGQVELRVKDDGAGFDPNQGGRGLGIDNMRARAEEFGGSFELISQPGKGTSVTFSIPSSASGVKRESRSQAVLLALVLVISIPVLAWTKSFGVSMLTTIATMGLVRYAIAYRRASTQSRASR